MLVIVLLIQYFAANVSSIKIKILSVINGDNPLYGFVAAAPAIEVAHRDMARQYPHILNNHTVARYTVHSSGMPSCPDAATLMLTLSRNISDILYNSEAGFSAYFSVNPPEVPTFGNLTWQKFDQNDTVAFHAYHSLAVVNNPNPKWEQVRDITSAMAEVSKERWNLTMSVAQQHNDLAISVYEAYQTFAFVLNESFAELENLTGVGFAKRCWNRTFESRTRPVNIDARGSRINSVIFSRFNSPNGVRTVRSRSFKLKTVDLDMI
ncbi:hypothetical protein RvY_15067 [Ramazzottius varieornatus]|uniref:Receptor ligand binding region domain-containing protein n=1 Tax=Ramazzottius varieornatus TaxID=947166 RepID=A0A1D1W0L6_RAMVA|nr:hypothetical protein RvY_15067 [Ramazzottius varieornatus]